MLDCADALRSLLVIGDFRRLHGHVTKQPVLVAPVLRNTVVPANVPAISVRLSLDVAGDLLELLTFEPAVTGSVPARRNTHLYSGVCLDDPIVAAANRHLPEGADVANWVPLCLLDRSDSEPDSFHIYGQLRFRGSDALFMRLTAEPVRPAAGTGAAGLAELVDLAAEFQNQASRYMGNHLGWYERLHPDRELEYKYQLEPPVNLWAVTGEGYSRISHGGLPGYFAEYGDELKRFDFYSTLYEVAEPEEQIGYVSFARGPAGQWIIKQKTFKEDSFDRGEVIWRQPDLHGGTFEGEMEHRGLGGRVLGQFRRQSYELHVESARSGHIFTIVVDESTPDFLPGVSMNQCELEYVHTRSCLPPEPEVIITEMNEVRDFTAQLLGDLGIGHTATYYSKLSFLRDCLAKAAL